MRLSTVGPHLVKTWPGSISGVVLRTNQEYQSISNKKLSVLHQNCVPGAGAIAGVV